MEIMKKISEKFVEKAILKHLAKKGWDYNIKTKGLHERGCDIVVTDSRKNSSLNTGVFKDEGEHEFYIVPEVKRRIPWQAARHLCLYIFSVDDRGHVAEYSPQDFKKSKNHKNRHD